jgi:hypothetical protein
VRKEKSKNLVQKIKVDLSEVDMSERVVLGSYAAIPFADMDKLKCHGRHLLIALWILRRMDKVLKRKGDWFYVDPDVVEEYGTNRKDWYRAVKRLADMDIIRIRLRSGPFGRNLYCFSENLEEAV